MTRTIRAFIVASLIAALVNALIFAVDLQASDAAGFLVITWRVFLISALGLPFAFAATIGLGIPAYALMRRFTEPSLVMVLTAGVLIGAIVTAAFALATGSGSSMPLARTIPIGLIAASAWWWAANPGEGVEQPEIHRQH
jgi:hypothetical protein